MQGATLFGFLQQKGPQLRLVLAAQPPDNFDCAVYFVRQSKAAISPDNIEVEVL
jgi:hypothetical protein